MRRVGPIVAAMMLTCSAVAGVPTTAPARIDRFIGDETAVVIGADLSHVDIDPVSKWLADVALASFAATEVEAEKVRAPIELTRRGAVEWVRKFRADGGSHVIVTSEFEWLLDAGFALYVPLPPETPSKPIEELFAGLHWGGRNSAAPVKTLEGNIVGFLGGATRELRPAKRTDFIAAFADLPADAPLRIVIAPDKTFREKTPKQWPESANVLAAEEWLAIAVDLKSGGTVDFTLQGRGEAGAQVLFDYWTGYLKRTFDPAEPRDGLKDANQAVEAKKLIALLTPRFDDDRLRLSLPAAALPRLIRAARPAIRQAERLRVRDVSAHNMTRLLVGLRGYAAKHLDWTFDLHDVAPFLKPGELSTIWLNPAEARNVNPGYIYVRPAVPIPPNDCIVLHENRPDGVPFGDWRLVGFADGRVEVVYDESRFNRLIGKR